MNARGVFTRRRFIAGAGGLVAAGLRWGRDRSIRQRLRFAAADLPRRSQAFPQSARLGPTLTTDKYATRRRARV